MQVLFYMLAVAYLRSKHYSKKLVTKIVAEMDRRSQHIQYVNQKKYDWSSWHRINDPIRLVIMAGWKLVKIRIAHL